MSLLSIPGDVTSSPWGKYQQYEGTWDSTIALFDVGIQPLEELPANLGTAPNLLADYMAEVTGLTPSQCDFEVVNSINNADPNLASSEITSLNGIHIASPQAGGQTAPSRFSLCFKSSPAGQWILDNTSAGANYAIMVTLFLRCTRGQLASAPAQSLMHITNGVAATTNFLYFMEATPEGTSAVRGSPPNVSPQYITGHIRPPLEGEAGLTSVSSLGWTGSKPSTATAHGSRCLVNLGVGDAWAGFNYNKAGSYILYRAQLDLIQLSDVGGPSLADKVTTMRNTLQAMANRDFAEGGRFHGDIYTPPATLKP